MHDPDAIGDSIASGSFQTMGMIVIPCSMKTVAGIVSGYSDNLLLRAADVTLKERRKLVLVARESPLGTIHLRNLHEASLLGAVIFPSMLTCYHNMTTMQEHAAYLAERVLAQFGLTENTRQWTGMETPDEYVPCHWQGAGIDKHGTMEDACAVCELSHELFGRKIQVVAVCAGEGIQVSIAGGDQPHIGAISICDFDHGETTRTYPGHKEDLITLHWAKRLYDAGFCPALVSGGIHYDGLSTEGIGEVMRLSDQMLEELLGKLRSCL